MNLAARILKTEFTYRVEIRHSDSGDWTHIHCPDWETTTSYGDASTYAVRVRVDHPDAEVRIVESAEGYPDVYLPVS